MYITLHRGMNILFRTWDAILAPGVRNEMQHTQHWSKIWWEPAPQHNSRAIPDCQLKHSRFQRGATSINYTLYIKPRYMPLQKIDKTFFHYTNIYQLYGTELWIKTDWKAAFRAKKRSVDPDVCYNVEERTEYTGSKDILSHQGNMFRWMCEFDTSIAGGLWQIVCRGSWVRYLEDAAENNDCRRGDQCKQHASNIHSLEGMVGVLPFECCWARMFTGGRWIVTMILVMAFKFAPRPSELISTA